MERIFTSKTHELNSNEYNRIHFISSTGNKNSKAYSYFYIPDEKSAFNHDSKNDILAIFKFAFVDDLHNSKLRQFIVVISKSGNKYYNNIFEINNSESDYYKISELITCDDFPIAKNVKAFRKNFARYMSVKHKCDTSEISSERLTENGTHFTTKRPTILHFVPSLNKEFIKHIFDGVAFYNGKYVFNSTDLFYTIGKDIKTKFYFKNLFIRKQNGRNQICFTTFDYREKCNTEFSYIDCFNLPENTNVISVFGYTLQMENGYKRPFIVVINKTEDEKYKTSLFWEACGKTSCDLIQVVFNKHDTLFKDVKKHEDFIKVFPKIWKENEEKYKEYYGNDEEFW